MPANKPLSLIQRVTDDEERRRAESLATRERRVTDCEAKLAELERYHTGYLSEFAHHAARGIDGGRVREFQAFLSRLAEALRQQSEVVERAKADRDAELSSWRRAAQRAQMVDHVVKRREADERRISERREQRESDERSARTFRRHEH